MLCYRRFVERDAKANDSNVFQQVVGNVLLGLAEWVERMRRSLAQTKADKNVPQRQQLAWRTSVAEIEAVVAQEFKVEPATMHSKRVRMNEARSAAVYLIRKLTTESTASLADRYGGVSAAAISKSVARTEQRLQIEALWRQRIARLEKRLGSRG